MVAAVSSSDFPCSLPCFTWKQVHFTDLSAFFLDQLASVIATLSFTFVVTFGRVSNRLVLASFKAFLHLLRSECFSLIGGTNKSLFSSNQPIVRRLMVVAVSLSAFITFSKKGVYGTILVRFNSGSLSLKHYFVLTSFFIFSQSIWLLVILFSLLSLIEEIAIWIPTAKWSLGIPLHTTQFRTLLQKKEEMEKMSSICGRLGGR